MHTLCSNVKCRKLLPPDKPGWSCDKCKSLTPACSVWYVYHRPIELRRKQTNMAVVSHFHWNSEKIFEWKENLVKLCYPSVLVKIFSPFTTAMSRQRLLFRVQFRRKLVTNFAPYFSSPKTPECSLVSKNIYFKSHKLFRDFRMSTQVQTTMGNFSEYWPKPRAILINRFNALEYLPSQNSIRLRGIRFLTWFIYNSRVVGIPVLRIFCRSPAETSKKCMYLNYCLHMRSLVFRRRLQVAPNQHLHCSFLFTVDTKDVFFTKLDAYFLLDLRETYSLISFAYKLRWTK